MAIVLELQARRTKRAEDLAATFEVRKRTIYRDVEALSEMGVPVVSVPGRDIPRSLIGVDPMFGMS